MSWALAGQMRDGEPVLVLRAQAYDGADDVVDGNTFHSPVQIRRGAERDTTGDESRYQVVGIGPAGARVSSNERGSRDRDRKSARGRGADERLGDAFALGIAEVEAVEGGEHVDALVDDTRAA